MPKPAFEDAEPTSGSKPTRRAFLVKVAALSGSLLVTGPSPAAPLVGKPKGRPRIVVDRISLPRGIPEPGETLRHVKFALKREARRTEWGAGTGSTIALRFTIDALELVPHGNVLKIRCSALGELPRRRIARSQLTYSGALAEQKQLIFRVLDIVVRGVVARLSDLERTRRGA